MKTYDLKDAHRGRASFWDNVREVLRRWLDRERELMALRNAVGMMSEARRADAAEWHAMAEARRGDAAAMGEMRDDARRLRWLAYDHADPAVRERVRSICQSLPMRGLGGVRMDIDANMNS